jgi:hypothetical protein
MKKIFITLCVIGMALGTRAQQAPQSASQDVQVTLNLRPILGYTIQQKQPENSLYMPVRFEPNKSPFANIDFRIFSSVPYDYTVTRKGIPGKSYSVTCTITEK